MRSFIRLLLLTCCGIFFTACKDSPEENISYEEISDADSQDAIKKAFIDSSEGIPEAKIPDGIEKYFRLLGKAARSGNPVDTERFLSIFGMLSALESSGALDSFTSKEKRGFDKGFRGAASQLGTSLQQMAYDDFKISLVEKIDDDQRLVYTKLYDNELNVVTQMRWWLVLTEDGWRAYDFEDVSIGLRTVKLMGTMLKSGIGSNKEPWVDLFIVVARSLQTLDFSDSNALLQLEDPLLRLRKHKLPNDIEMFASMMMTSVLTIKGEYQEALAELEVAEKSGIVAPLFHYQKGSVLAQLGRHEEALLSYEAHVKKLGSDSDSLELIADSYLELGNVERAQEAALQGLADNPNSPGCLASLLLASSPEEVASDSMNERFAKSANVQGAIEIALAISFEDKIPLAKALVAVLKKKFPTSESIELYEDELK